MQTIKYDKTKDNTAKHNLKQSNEPQDQNQLFITGYKLIKDDLLLAKVTLKHQALLFVLK